MNIGYLIIGIFDIVGEKCKARFMKSKMKQAALLKMAKAEENVSVGNDVVSVGLPSAHYESEEATYSLAKRKVVDKYINDPPVKLYSDSVKLQEKRDTLVKQKEDIENQKFE